MRTMIINWDGGLWLVECSTGIRVHFTTTIMLANLERWSYNGWAICLLGQWIMPMRVYQTPRRAVLTPSTFDPASLLTL